MIKRWLALMLLMSGIVVIMANNSMAITNECIYPNQTIVSLYDETNSHVALFNETYNDTNAKYGICYEQIYGANYNGDKPWNCNGNNKVLGLKSINNSHAEAPSLSNYPINVCYGDLQCELSVNACRVNEKEVLSLSSNANVQLYTNSHAGKAGAYGLKLCCSSASAPTDNTGFKTLEWRDFLNNKISEANVNDSVKIYVEMHGTENGEVNITIKRKILLGLLDIELLKTKINLINGIGETNWLINDSVMDGSDRKFIFIAERGNNEPKTSEELRVINKEVCRPTLDIEINKPIDGGVYLIGIDTEINYTLARASEAKGILLRWSINENSFSTTNKSFFYKFASQGAKTIHLEASNACGVSVEREVRILVVGEGNSILAFISAPKYRQIFPFVRPRIWVPYNGTGSYVIKATNANNVMSIDCVAGICPTNVANSPQTIINNPTQGFSELFFNWKRKEQENIQQIIPFGFGNVSGMSLFGDGSESNTLDDKEYLLQLNYTDNANSISLQENTNRSFSVGKCIENRNFWLLNNSNGVYIGKVKTINSAGGFFANWACKGENRQVGGGDDCCPNGYACTENNGCVIIGGGGDLPPNFGCGQYTSRAICENANPSEQQCNDGAPTASCVWSNGRCIQQTNIFGVNDGDFLNQVNVSYRNLTNCNLNTGFWEVNITRECANADVGAATCGLECGSEIKLLPCGRPSFELPFFGIWQFAIALTLIIIIYLFFNVKNKMEKRQNEKQIK